MARVFIRRWLTFHASQNDGVIPDEQSREAYLKIMAEAVLSLRPVGNTN